MKTYSAFLANDEGEPTTVEVGGGRDENTAAKIGIRMANMYRQSVAVVEKDTVTGNQRVCQVIRYIDGMAIAPREPSPPVQIGARQRFYLSLCKLSDPALWKFVQYYAANGYTVTLSPSLFDPGLFNAVAVKS